MHMDLARDAMARELSAWKQFTVSSPIMGGAHGRAFADTRWVLPRRVVDWEKTAEARLVAAGFQDPDMGEGNLEIAGCVSRWYS